MKYNESELSLLAESINSILRKVRNAQLPGAHVNEGDVRLRHRVENAHLAGNLGDIYDLGNLRMKAIQGALGGFSIKCAQRYPLRRQIVYQRAGHRRLTDAAFVRAYQDYCRRCHHRSPHDPHVRSDAC